MDDLHELSWLIIVVTTILMTTSFFLGEYFYIDLLETFASSLAWKEKEETKIEAGRVHFRKQFETEYFVAKFTLQTVKLR